MARERDRLREPEARILALRIAASRPNREATTTYIKDHIEDYIDLTPKDLLPSKTRGREPMYRQIVGNVVSHKPSSVSIFAKGYAVRLKAKRPNDGIRVDEKGIEYLKKLGY